MESYESALERGVRFIRSFDKQLEAEGQDQCLKANVVNFFVKEMPRLMMAQNAIIDLLSAVYSKKAKDVVADYRAKANQLVEMEDSGGRR